VWAPDPLPMLGQLWVVEPELDEPELELEPELVLPELELPDPELPVLEVEDGVVDVLEPELELEPVPVLPVVLVVAALATSAPPARSPDVSAPMASTLRRRICMGGLPFHLVWCTGPFGPAPHTLHPQPWADRRTT